MRIDSSPGIGLVEQRQGRLVLAVALAIGVVGVFFLNLGRVQKQYLCQVSRCGRAENWPLEAGLNQAGEVSGVIYVSVREYCCFYAASIERGRLPVEETQLFEALEQPAVHQ